jgi:hypothetical protein
MGSKNLAAPSQCTRPFFASDPRFFWLNTTFDFRLLLVRNLIEEAGKNQDHPTPSLVGRPSVAAANIVQLESHHNENWPSKSTQLHCCLCSSHGQSKTKVYKCAKCDMGLCMVPCFTEYDTKVNL